MKNQNIKSKLADLKKKADYRKSALPSVKDAQDAKIENKMANELEPYVYKLITEALYIGLCMGLQNEINELPADNAE